MSALMLLTLRGTPFLYQGEEIGMADGPVPPDRIVDVADRDPERTPMQWDATPNGAFTTGDPWLPVNPETSAVNVEAQRRDPDSIFELYRTLIRIRRASPALRRGEYRTLPNLPDQVYGYEREFGAERWFVFLNFGDAIATIDTGERARVRLSTDCTREIGPEQVTGTIHLRPEEGILVSLGEAAETS
jgi:alpha-glucosidase